jgi:hypothetical protein
LTEEPDKKKKLWEVDPMLFQKGRKGSLLQRRIVPSLRQIGKFSLICLALTYPIYLVLIGLVFGGVAFWSFLGGSVAVIGIIISRLGFAPNFRNWDVGGKGMIGLVLGFLVAVAFYTGLLYLKTWLVLPAILLGFGAFFVVRRLRS